MRLLIISLITTSLIFTSCLVDAPIPLDWKYNKPEHITIDTIPTDTIQPLEVDTCETYTEVTNPPFVTLYIKFDEQQDSVLWEGGGIQSYDLAEVVSQITSLPAKIDTSPIGMSVLLKGTNNHSQFQLKVFTRIDGAKWYAGTAMQALILPGADPAYYKECMIEYPSYNQFSFWGVDCDCDQGIALSREPLKDCHEGRWYADLFFLPCQPPQSVRDSLDLYGWERIRASHRYITDLRHMDDVSDQYLVMIASSGHQIIVKD